MQGIIFFELKVFLKSFWISQIIIVKEVKDLFEIKPIKKSLVTKL